MRRSLLVLPCLLLAVACSRAPVVVPQAPQALAAPTPPPPLPPTAKPVVEEVIPPMAPTVLRQRTLDTPLWTQTIAVLDVKIQKTVPDTFTEDLTQPITERVEGAFLATGRFDMVERARLDALHGEMMATSDSLWFDQSSVAKMGKGLGAKYVILPSVRLEVGVFTTRMDLLVKVLDVETGGIVQNFDVRTASSSASVNSSITACLDRIRLELTDTIRPVYPAQAVVVHVPQPGVMWAEAKQVQMFRPGQKVRILRNEEVYNPIMQTNAPFTVEAGRGRIQSISPQGIVVRADGVKAEEGWLVEVIR